RRTVWVTVLYQASNSGARKRFRKSPQPSVSRSRPSNLPTPRTRLLQERLHEHTRQALARLTELRVYRPDYLVPQPAVETFFQAFLRGNRPLLLVEGTGGAGKTTWLFLSPPGVCRRLNGMAIRPAFLIQGLPGTLGRFDHVGRRPKVANKRVYSPTAGFTALRHLRPAHRPTAQGGR